MNSLHPLAGKLAPPELLIDPQKLLNAYLEKRLDPEDPSHRVSFGTSGHRGSSLLGSFNGLHVAAMTQAVCDFRRINKITGPLFVGIDTHLLSKPALETAIEVLAGNGVETLVDLEGYTPTPAVSHAILAHNRERKDRLADGIVLTPSHNPPADGGFKYNPPEGGPAGTDVTDPIERRANELLLAELRKPGSSSIRAIPFSKALRSPQVKPFDFIRPYVDDLRNVIDVDVIRASNIRIGVDPMGGSNLAHWDPIAETYGLKIDVVNRRIDPTFSFMSVDRDGQIRMDCSSPYAMANLVKLRGDFDIAFGNDADSDRHGIVTPSGGLMNPNHYLTSAIAYLCLHRPHWKKNATIGKTLVSSALMDRVAERMGRSLQEVPVGFKWFVPGLLDGTLCFGGEESAGASFLKKDGTVWTTDKDGILLNLLAAEITARTEQDPSRLYVDLTREFGEPVYERMDAPADARQRQKLKKLSADDVRATTFAGEPILEKLTHAPGNGAPIGGLKVITKNGWFAARPSGTENVYKIYAESFLGRDHLKRIQDEAQEMVASVLKGIEPRRAGTYSPTPTNGHPPEAPQPRL